MATLRGPSLLLVGILVTVASADILFPFGNGDTAVNRQDDTYSDAILLQSTPFPFFGRNFTSVYVGTNGIISFDHGVSTYTPSAFPQSTPMLAAFWGDVDVRYGGSVTYRHFSRDPSSEGIYGQADGQADGLVRQKFTIDFTASWMLIATWHNVPFYGADDVSITNSFQAVLMTDGSQSFVLYNYKEIRWTAGTASGGSSSTGLGGTPAQVGYNSGDGNNYYTAPGSMTADIVNIDQQSNTDTTGRWLFRINSGQECGETARDLACQILGKSAITLYDTQFNAKGFNDGADAKSNIRDTCDGLKAKRSSYNCRIRGRISTSPGGSVCLSDRLLQYVLAMAVNHTIQVNTLAGGCHSSTSRHYGGTAVDLHVPAGSTDYEAWMTQCSREGGADVESRGPGSDSTHSTHTHCGFPYSEAVPGSSN